MSEEVDKLTELEDKLIAAAEKAVTELIKIAEAPILKKGGYDPDDEVAAEKMKNAASAKKASLFDAYDIIDKTRERKKLRDEADGKAPEEIIKKNVDISFAEGRAK